MSFRVLGDPYSWLGRSVGKGGGLSAAPNQVATFEGGLTTPNPTGFDVVNTAGGGAVAVNTAAALRGIYGFDIILGGAGNQAYGTLSGPNNENEITLEFLMNVSALTMANGNVFSFLWLNSAGVGGLAALINIVFGGGNFQFQVFGRNDAGVNVGGVTQVFSGMNTLCIKINLKTASAVGANDGLFRMYVDGALFHQILNMDNDTQLVTGIQVGGIAGLDAGTTGNLYLDDIEWINRLI